MEFQVARRDGVYFGAKKPRLQTLGPLFVALLVVIYMYWLLLEFNQHRA